MIKSDNIVILDITIQLRVSEADYDRYDRYAKLRGKNLSQTIRETMTQAISESISSESDYDDPSTWKLDPRPTIHHKVRGTKFDIDNTLEVAFELKRKSIESEGGLKEIYEELVRLALQLSETR